MTNTSNTHCNNIINGAGSLLSNWDKEVLKSSEHLIILGLA